MPEINDELGHVNINYGQTTKGKTRWTNSEIIPLSDDEIGKRRIGPTCPQLKQHSPLSLDDTIANQIITTDEQCLNLNIFTPKVRTRNSNVKTLLPVMVWIHGGGFQIGSSALKSYDGKYLANRANVIVVTINYRLGMFGFLRLQDISRGVIPSTGNEGLNDQVTALKWINKHIVFFGGDNTNVTLFGESAGAMSIACLLASPRAKGLFHKAILQSGAGHTYSSKDKANHVAQEVINSANALGYSLKEFNEMTTDELLSVQEHFLKRPDVYQKFGMLPFTPVIDNELLLAAPHDAIKQGSAKDITIIAGSNTDEWTFFASMINQKISSSSMLHHYLTPLVGVQQVPAFVELAKRQLLDREKAITDQNILTELLGDYWFTEPCRRLLENHTASGGVSFRYKLGRKTNIESLGCTHITDIGFVFGTTSANFHGTEPRVNSLTAEMQNCWGAFAHSGSPSTAAVKWPRYSITDSADKDSIKTHYQFTYFDHNATYLAHENTKTMSLWSLIHDQQLAAF